MKIVITTFDTELEARSIAEQIVTSHLASCVQIIPIESVYEWEGKLTNAKEIRLEIKVKDSGAEKLVGWLEENHSYDTPEIVAIKPDQVNKKYLEWIDE